MGILERLEIMVDKYNNWCKTKKELSNISILGKYNTGIIIGLIIGMLIRLIF